MDVTIIANDYSLINGGVEYHAEVLLREFNKFKLRATRVTYNNIFTKFRDLRKSNILIFEGIRRIHLLFMFLFERELLRKVVIFTHGSFMYYTRSEELKKIGYFNPLIPFWSIFDSLLTNPILRQVVKVITLSSTEKSEVIQAFQLANDKVGVIDNFVSSSSRDFISEKEKNRSTVFLEFLEAKKPYVCTVSRIDKRKNIKSAVGATHQLKLNYILAGKDQGGLKPILRVVRKLSVNSFIYLGKISDYDKFALISNSIGYIQPSFFEMVPFSVYEALSLGTPVLLTKLSYIGTLPNVITCDPDIPSIKIGLSELIKMSSRGADLKSLVNVHLKSPNDIFNDFISSIGQLGTLLHHTMIDPPL